MDGNASKLLVRRSLSLTGYPQKFRCRFKLIPAHRMVVPHRVGWRPADTPSHFLAVCNHSRLSPFDDRGSQSTEIMQPHDLRARICEFLGRATYRQTVTRADRWMTGNLRTTVQPHIRGPRRQTHSSTIHLHIAPCIDAREVLGKHTVTRTGMPRSGMVRW